MRLLSPLAAILAMSSVAASPPAKNGKDASTAAFDRTVRPFLAGHCTGCHNNKLKTGDVSFEFSDSASASSDTALWDEVRLKLRDGQMPPAGLPRPADAEVQPVLRWIEQELDRRAAGGVMDPGRVTARRLNRAEYNQTIHDLFGIPIRPADDFPADDSGYGFDNIGDVLSVPPLLMESYLKAAEQVAAAVVPLGAPMKPSLARHLADNLEQSRRVEYDDPVGYPYPPGAFEAKHVFPVDAEYDLVLRVKDRRKDKSPLVPLNFYFDGKQIGKYQVQDGEYQQGTFVVRQVVTAGEHTLYGEFPKEYVNKEAWDEKQYGKALFKEERRIYVDQFEVQGPFQYDPRKTAEWQRIFVCQEHTDDCARRILQIQARRAFRRPADPAEIERLMRLVSLAKQQGDSFEAGIQLALKAILVSPNFLFRIERDPTPSQIHRISDLELATRLSYFLWSSTPDEELLDLGEQGRLHDPPTLEAQVHRMLMDPRSDALEKNFAGQWLQLRNLDKVHPDPDLFPQFNDYLRQSMVAETEAYFTYVMRENRSIIEFLDSNYTFLNSRLARHYGIAGVEGRNLRRVELQSNERGGILTQAAVLTVSSYPTRTSPVLRGLWVLENLLGAPPPPPPAGVPPLDEKKIGLDLPLRKQLEQHRADPSCAVCHLRMDAIGFGLENYSPVGTWRTQDGKFPVDSSGTLPGGKTFQGPGDLKRILAGDKDAFTRTLSAKMLTYALGRGLERSDSPAVQLIARNVAAEGYRFTALITGIVRSAPFQMRRGEGAKQ
jgi:hypothetical protein